MPCVAQQVKVPAVVSTANDDLWFRSRSGQPSLPPNFLRFGKLVLDVPEKDNTDLSIGWPPQVALYANQSF